MFGSSILDIAIGLIFVYLLLSLIVTAASEMIASWFKRRHDKLWKGIINLLGLSWAEKLYDHPLVKGLSPPAKLKWTSAKGIKQKLHSLLSLPNVDANGPSYIPSRTFVVSLLDVIGFKPDGNPHNELRNALNAFPDTLVDARTLKTVSLAAANTALAGNADSFREFQGFLLTIPDTASFAAAAEQLQRFLDATPTRFGNLKTFITVFAANISKPTLTAGDVKAALLGAVAASPTATELGKLLDYIPNSASAAVVKQEVLAFLDKMPLQDPLSGLPADLQGTDLAKTLQLLWDEAGHDLEAFKGNLAMWFNDAMDRVSGWYKRETQVVNLALALVFTLAINVDTILLVNTLSKSPALRDSLVAQATKFAEHPPAQLQLASATPSGTNAVTADSAISVTNEPFTLSLSPSTVPGGEDVMGTINLRQTNSTAVLFKLISSDTNLVSVPSRVIVPIGQKSIEFEIKTRAMANSARVNIGASNRVAVLQLLPSSQEQFRAARAELDNLNLPIGWVLETNTSSSMNVGAAQPVSLASPDRNHQLFLVLVSPTNRLFWNTIAFHWLGWVVTAIAVSLGAPFWFDLLNKFITIRSSGAAPEETPKPPKGSPVVP